MKEDEPATAPQRKYANQLGLTFPADISKAAMSELIRRKVDLDREEQEHDGDPEAGLINFARGREITFNSAIGRSRLYRRVFKALNDEGKIQFFVFAVYRWLSGDREANLDASPHRQALIDVATELLRNPQATRSVLRYEGQDLQFFRATTGADGRVHTGGSQRTIGYKETAKLLRSRSLVAADEPPIDKRDQTPEAAEAGASKDGSSVRHAPRSNSWGVFLICALVLLGAIGYWLSS